MKPLTLKTIGLLNIALAVTSCSDDAPFSPGTAGESRTIVAELTPEEMSSRSCIDESTLNSKYIDVLWEPTDTLGVYGTTTRNAMFTTADDRTSSASFSGVMTAGDTPTGVYYPYSAANAGRDASDLRGTLSLTQDYWQRHPAVDNDWRIGTPTSREGVFRFRHLFSTLHFRINAADSKLAGEKLESITLTVTGQDGTKRQLGGDFSFSLADGFDSFTSTPSDANVLTMRWRDCPELTAGTTYHGFITCAPTVKKEDKIVIKIRTTTKEATLTRTSLADFRANTAYTFPLTIKNYTDISVADRTDVDAEALYHPSMILRHEDLARIQHAIRTVPALAAMHNRIIALCEKYIDEPTVTNNAVKGKTRWTVTNGTMDQGQSGAEVAATRVMSLAYAYRMTLDSRYADRAIKEMTSLATMSKAWSEYQALDAAEVMTGVAYGYDWLYDVMTSTQRNQVRSALKSKGLDVIDEICQRESNQNSVGNCGGVTAALALRHNSSYTSAANIAITRAQTYNNLILKTYTGNYPEGPAYWGYGTDYQVLMFQALEDAMGESAYTDILSSYKDNFFRSARYIQMSIGTTGLTFNYSDTRMPTIFEMASFWFAYKSGDNTYAYADMTAMKRDAYSYPSCNYPEQFLVPLMSFASRIDFAKVSDPGINHYVANSSGDTQPIFIYRSGWQSDTDTYLGVKGGMANNKHGHMDAGSFVYDYNGERWASDLGGQDYAIYQASHDDLWNYANGSGRWSIFRYGNLAHNTITINSKEHRSINNNTSTVGLATITETFQTDTKHGCVIDMKKALSYPTSYPVQSATRTIYVDNLDVLHIEDLIRANSSKDASVTWTMVTGATPTINGNDIILVKNGKRMKLSVTPSTAQAYVTNCAGQNSYDVENPGMSRVGFTHTISKGQQASINVQLEPLDD